MSEQVIRKKRRSQDSKRLTLSEKAQVNVENWLVQIKDEFKGMLDLKRNEVLNFILEEMGENLTKDFLTKLRSEKLTDSHIAKWIYKKTLEAEKEGLEPNFDELVKTAQGSAKRVKKPRKTKKQYPQVAENIASDLTTNNTENLCIIR